MLCASGSEEWSVTITLDSTGEYNHSLVYTSNGEVNKAEEICNIDKDEPEVIESSGSGRMPTDDSDLERRAIFLELVPGSIKYTAKLPIMVSISFVLNGVELCVHMWRCSKVKYCTFNYANSKFLERELQKLNLIPNF